MHARHRGQGNGYRSNAFGMGGGGSTSWVSPEGSSRGRGFYNSEYRNYNRSGFGRGQRRQFQPPQPPPRRVDIFTEAGRLAAEYLISKGLLPPNALFTGKWQNGSLKNQVGNFQSLRSMEDGMSLSADGRTSAETRVGNSPTDIGPGRRTHFDEYNTMGSRDYMATKRRRGSFKNYGSELKRELGRSGSWTEKARESPDIEADDDGSSRHKNEQQVSKEGDTGFQNSPPREGRPQSDNAESSLGRNKSVDDPNANENPISSDTKKNLSSENNVEAKPTYESDDKKKSDAEGVEVKDENNRDETEQQGGKEDISVDEACPEKESQEGKNSCELLKFSRYANVPTKTRSSLVTKGAKVQQESITEPKESNESEFPTESSPYSEDVHVDSSSVNDLSNPNSKSSDSDVKKEPVLEEEQTLAYANEPPEFGRSASTYMERGEKRAVNNDAIWDGTKKPREWATSVDTQSDGCLALSGSMNTPPTSAEPMTSNFEDRPDQKRLMDASFFHTEEKQLFPGSLKAFDLNLVGVSEVNENHDTNPVAYPSITGNGKQAMRVDIDLSVGNTSNASDRYNKWESHDKDIEVIDLESDSLHEEKDFNSSERRPESEFASLDGFPHNPHGNEMADAQDGYGLMIMELLGNDIPNCSSVPTDMNSLHNEMGLQTGEGILADDDYIYKALGEIPSFSRVWEHPNQEYGKPF